MSRILTGYRHELTPYPRRMTAGGWVFTVLVGFGLAWLICRSGL